jgi:hypothetical protein
MNEGLSCWKCGHTLDELPKPLRRRDECPACRADLHVCRMCEFYDTSVAKSCREPVAEEVNDKERANFCDYFRAIPGVQATGGHSESEEARAKLEAMFDMESKPASGDASTDGATLMDRRREEEEAARKQLDDLFGLDDKKS